MYRQRVFAPNFALFKKDDPDCNLLNFACDALAHMVHCKMDAVFHMKGTNPGSPEHESTGAVELFTHHARHTKACVSQVIADRIKDGAFDRHSVEALKESCT